jgi:hypothetical protein
MTADYLHKKAPRTARVTRWMARDCSPVSAASLFSVFPTLERNFHSRCETKLVSARFAVGLSNKERAQMCDYSLQNVRSRSAQVGDKLTTRDFGTGTHGFSASEDAGMAVCVLPGTELAFAREVSCISTGLLPWRDKLINHKTAIFRQANKDKAAAHHDALEFPDGRLVLLTLLREGQEATVLQLPARPQTTAEAASQKRAAYTG